MIDLEEALRPLIDTAPEPPALRPRHTRRRHGLVAAALVLVLGAAVALVALVAMTNRDRPATVSAGLQPSTRAIVLPDGRHFEIETRGFELGDPVFHAALMLGDVGGVNIDITRSASGQWNIDYQDSALTPDQLAETKSLTNTREQDGYLVVDTQSPLRLSSTDAPDVDFGNLALLLSGYDEACPDVVLHSTESGTWWCDVDAHVRLHASDPDFDITSVDVRAVPDTNAVAIPDETVFVPGDIDESPLRERTAPFVGRAGAGVVVFGGEFEERARLDGAVFDPNEKRWIMIEPAPLPDALYVDAAVDPNARVLYAVADGTHESARYDMAAGRWTELDPVPLDASDSRIDLAWTPGGVLALQWQPEPQAALLDLTTGEWRTIDAPPLGPRYGADVVWTGSEVIVWGGQRFDNSPWLDGASYFPADEQWRPLPNAPFGGRTIDYFNGLYRPSAVWTGDEMVVWGWEHQSLGEITKGAAYDPATATWRAIADAGLDPRASCECAGGETAAPGPDGTVVVWTGNLDRRGSYLMRYDPAADTWATVAGPFASDSSFNRVVVVGGEALVFGPDLRIPL